MTDPYRPRLKAALAARDEALAILERLDASTLRRFYELGQVSAQPDGFPPGAGDSASGGDVARPTEAAALAPAVLDPVGNWIANLFLILCDELKGHAIQIDDLRAKILEIKPSGRTNQIDTCTACHQPNPHMHRIDGAPYCATSCYHRENRRRRGQAEEAS